MMIEWIKCSDILPKIGEPVLVFTNFLPRKIMVFFLNKISLDNTEYCWDMNQPEFKREIMHFNNVSHWMALPELPEFE